MKSHFVNQWIAVTLRTPVNTSTPQLVTILRRRPNLRLVALEDANPIRESRLGVSDVQKTLRLILRWLS
jgi:hypothetical protein